MKKLLIVLTFLVAACRPADVHPLHNYTPVTTTTPLTVKFDGLSGFSNELREKVIAASQKLEVVLASKAFKSAVLNHTYKGKKQFVQNGGLTNEQIYRSIMIGREKLHKEIDYTMNLTLQTYYEDSLTIAYTYSWSDLIYVNTKWYDRFGQSQIASNLTHEWLHKVGFAHDYSNTSRRPYSVPYGVGNIVEALVREMY